MSLVGITNHNEFFTSHFISEIFPADVKEIISQWHQKHEQNTDWQMPNRALRGLAKQYFQFLDQFTKKMHDDDQKLQLARNFYADLLSALGYEYLPTTKSFEDKAVPILAELKKENGATHAWVIETYSQEPADSLTLFFQKFQFSQPEINVFDKNLEEIISSEIFTLDEPPRWIIVLSPFQLTLIDRHKWTQKRLLQIDLNEIFARREDETIKAVAALCYSGSIIAKEGETVLDRLDEHSHKHAFGVTEDLKFALRESIELLANEAIFFASQQNPDFIKKSDLDEQLTRESLRYMYRLLFIFFIESRPELNYVPMKSEAYLQGYSIESLRDIEMTPLLTDEDKNGVFFHESVAMLFDMIFHGREEDAIYKGISTREERAFSIIKLPSHLFDPQSTPILNSVKIRNQVWQKIIRLMSLTRPGNGTKSRGRISYTNLGINQLGAVYEALLSYKGFIARETLYEVKKKGENPTALDNAYFVNETQLKDYTKEERVFNSEQKLVSYPAGTFIYRLAGRDREKSASYYTPEVLTECVVKYALKGLLKGKKADEILKITVCEPAMGSAAFLNEAINQLSEAYLEKKQIELNKRVPHDQYMLELQKVKMYIADNNVFGVDLNPTAVELAEVSLWLNALFTEVDEQTQYRTTYIPWFGFQLTVGNSLIGSRRQVYHKNLLEKDKSKKLLWLDETPKRLDPQMLKTTRSVGTDEAKKAVQLNFDGTKAIKKSKPKPQQKMFFEDCPPQAIAGRGEDEIYHFLLGDKAMADYSDKVIKDLRKDRIQQINKWKTSFLRPYEESEIDTLKNLSAAIDKIWVEHTAHQAQMRQKTTDPLLVWGQKQKRGKKSALNFKDSVLKSERFSENVQNSSLYSRLKLVMDYWCALWFWPIDEADKLPSRSEFLKDIAMLVEKQQSLVTMVHDEKDLFAKTMDEELQMAQLDEFGFVDVNELINTNPRLKIVKKLAQKNHFLHWELEYADIFAQSGGFDLILGNPPWLKVEWQEGGIMGEANPLFDIRKFSASQKNTLRDETFKQYSYLQSDYISEYESAAAIKNFLNSHQNYSDLKGMQTNLYKCFLPQSWMLGNKKAHIGFLHPEGVYDDPKGGKLREQIYSRLQYHFQFQNGLNLFPEVAHREKFSVNIYANLSKTDIAFSSISNLFHVTTIENSFNHNGLCLCYGIKDLENKWNLNGHKSRLINVDKKMLSLFANLYDTSVTTYKQARLPVIHSIELISVLEKIARYPKKLSDLKNEYVSTVMWDETNAQKAGTIKRETRFAKSPEELILSGPHFFVGNPCYKTPRRVCKEKADYDTLDLTILPDDYLPRTNYVPACNEAEYKKRTSKVPWEVKDENGKKRQPKVTEYYRLVNRRMLSQSGERTLIPTIIAPIYGHIDGVFSTSFKNSEVCLSFCATLKSLVMDFFSKTTGKSDCRGDLLNIFPLISSDNHWIKSKFLCLTCLNIYYCDLWSLIDIENVRHIHWAKQDPRLDNNHFKNLGPEWKREYALRTDYERRQALVEIDVLVAIELGMTLEELCAIYRIQFPVLRQNENDTWYDQKGRIVFTVSKGLPGVGLDRPSWQTESKLNKLEAKNIKVFNNDGTPIKQQNFTTIKDMKSGYIERIVEDDTIPDYRKAHCELLLDNGTILKCPCPDHPNPIEGPVKRIIRYHAPFDKCDRENDYKTTWQFFTSKK